MRLTKELTATLALIAARQMLQRMVTQTLTKLKENPGLIIILVPMVMRQTLELTATQIPTVMETTQRLIAPLILIVMTLTKVQKTAQIC